MTKSGHPVNAGAAAFFRSATISSLAAHRALARRRATRGETYGYFRFLIQEGSQSASPQRLDADERGAGRRAEGGDHQARPRLLGRPDRSGRLDGHTDGQAGDAG